MLYNHQLMIFYIIRIHTGHVVTYIFILFHHTIAGVTILLHLFVNIYTFIMHIVSYKFPLQYYF